MVKPEFTSIRDNSFSLWHRKLNDNYYMLDIDNFMWCLYDNNAEPLAVMEEKSSKLDRIDLNSFQFKALRKLVKKLPLFLLITNFNEDSCNFTFYVVAANKSARQFMKSLIKTDRTYLSEASYMKFESNLRKKKIDLSKMDKANILFDKFDLPEIVDFDDETAEIRKLFASNA